MASLDIFGFGAVAFMLLCYTLEYRHHIFILAFALGCAASAYYAFLVHNVPFMVVEGAWAFIAVQRWADRPDTPLPPLRRRNRAPRHRS